MKSSRLKAAENLANRPYQAHVFLDESTDGEPLHVAVVPEMPGCIAHGDTVEEALEWLESARVDHIWFLLEHKLEVPDPQLMNSAVVCNMLQYQDADTGAPNASDAFIVSSVPGFRIRD